MHLRAGMEPEMMWLRLNPDGTPSVEGKTKPYCYHIDQFSELQPIIHKMVEYGQKLGLDMIQGDHEDAPGQIELNFGFDRAEKTADNLSTFRQIAKQVGREDGAFPCFMPKPFMGVSANGCHTNISLWKGDENVFLPDGDDMHMPSQIGLNADRRHPRAPARAHLRHRVDGELVPPASGRRASGRRCSPTGATRTARLRCAISSPGPLRVPLGRLGRQPVPRARRADQGRWTTASSASSIPASPRSRNIYEAIEAGKTVKRVPMTLGEALDELEADEVVKSALPDEMYRVFMHYKRDEWERYCATVSDWDVQEYLDVLP